MIAERFDAFLLDLDGVVYLGDEALPDAIESVTRLREMGKKLRFITNDPRPTRTAVERNLRAMGIQASTDEIVTAGWATARHLSEQGMSTAAVVGSSGLELEIEAARIEVTDDDPEVMVVGADETTSYLDMQRATRHIVDGATFVGTSPDGAFPTPAGPAPGAGAIIRAVQEATDTTPTIVGKPEPLMFEMALGGLSNATKAVVIGDNPATDVIGAHRAGLPGMLVAEDEPAGVSYRDFPRPERTISTLAELF